MEYLRRQSKLVVGFILLAVIFLFATINVAPNNQTLAQYHLSVGKSVTVALAVVLPYLAIWAIALIGYLRFHTYVLSIAGSKDGEAMRVLSYGVFWLLIWLPYDSLASNLVTGVSSRWPAWTGTMHRLNAYCATVLLLLAFGLLYAGSVRVLQLSKRRPITDGALMWRQVFYTVYAVLAALFIYVIFSSNGGHRASTYFPDWVLLITIMVPRLIAWFLGLSAVWNLFAYAYYAAGNIYKRAFKFVAAGLGLVTLCLVAINGLNMTNNVNHLSLESILAIVFVLLLIMALGFVYLLLGAGRLARIERA